MEIIIDAQTLVFCIGVLVFGTVALYHMNKADKLKAENDLLRNELDLYKNHQETT
mgnify:CR=1 FL=1